MYQLLPRQDMAVHRFNQFSNKKSILLDHSVGSGKTLTSLTMAINSFNWGETNQARKDIIIVAPTGLFNNFLNDMLKIPAIDKLVNAIGENPPLRKETLIKEQHDKFWPRHSEAYRCFYTNKPFNIISYLYKDINLALGNGEFENCRRAFNNAVVIFDEAHRLFREIHAVRRSSLIILLEQQIMNTCKKFILMTGTPYNTTIMDTLLLVRLVECSNRGEAREGEIPCYQSSRFNNVHYLATLPGRSIKFTRNYFLCVNLILMIFNIIPDFISTDAIQQISDIWRFFKKKYSDWQRGIPLVWDDGLSARVENLQDEMVRVLNLTINPPVGVLNLDQAVEEPGTWNHYNHAFSLQGGKREEKKSEMFNPYLELEIEEKSLMNLTQEERIRKIKKQYKKLALKHHPNKQTEKTNRFTRIARAYELLSKKDDIELNDDLHELKNVYKRIHGCLSEDEIKIFVKTTFMFLSSKSYINYLNDNRNAFNRIITMYSDKGIFSYFLELTLTTFKENIHLSETYTPESVENECSTIPRGEDPTLVLLELPFYERPVPEALPSNSINVSLIKNNNRSTRNTHGGRKLKNLTRKKRIQRGGNPALLFAVIYGGLLLHVVDASMITPDFIITLARYFTSQSILLLKNEVATRIYDLQHLAWVMYENPSFLYTTGREAISVFSSSSLSKQILISAGTLVITFVGSRILSSLYSNFYGYMVRPSGLGTVFSEMHKKWYNLHIPADYRRMAQDCLNYISYIDKDIPDVAQYYSGKITEDGIKYKGLVDTTPKDIIDDMNNLPIVVTTYDYPQKEIIFNYNMYTDDQLDYMSQLHMTPLLSTWWSRHINKSGSFSIIVSDIRNPQLRCIGNYSRDYDTYTAVYKQGAIEADGIRPIYEIRRGINIEQPVADNELINVTFSCPKFLRVLQHILFMKTGNIFSYNTDKIIQPHLVTIGEEETTMTTDAYSDDIRTEYAKFIEPVIYNNATHYFLPLVWSCGGIDAYCPGINIFAAFLNRLGLKYIVLHDQENKAVLRKEMIRAINKVYPLNKTRELIQLVQDSLFVSSNNQDLYPTILNFLNANPDLREHPVCVLIHPEMTEGIDCKHNPAILLLEPPNSLVDYEQLCGRVLRTYGRRYDIRPNKIVYQFACYNDNEINNIWEKRFPIFKTNDDIARAGDALFYNEDGDTKTDIFVESQISKEELERYSPKGPIEWLAHRFLGFKKGGSFIETTIMNKAIWKAYIPAYLYTDLVPLAARNIDESMLASTVLNQFHSTDVAHNIKLYDIFMGRVNFKLAIMNKRNMNSINKLNNFLNTYNRFETSITVNGRDGEVGLTREQQVSREEQLKRDGVFTDREFKSIYSDIIRTLQYTQSPDILRIRELQQEDYKVRIFNNVFKELVFPDLHQINTFIEENNNATNIQWCNPLVAHYESNRNITCKQFSIIDENNSQFIQGQARNTPGYRNLIDTIRQFNYSEPTLENIQQLDNLYNAETTIYNNINLRYQGEGTEDGTRWWLDNPAPVVEAEGEVEVLQPRRSSRLQGQGSGQGRGGYIGTRLTTRRRKTHSRARRIHTSRINY